LPKFFNFGKVLITKHLHQNKNSNDNRLKYSIGVAGATPMLFAGSLQAILLLHGRNRFF